MYCMFQDLPLYKERLEVTFYAGMHFSLFVVTLTPSEQDYKWTAAAALFPL